MPEISGEVYVHKWGRISALHDANLTLVLITNID